ncbi:c-type cytochrome [Moraxella oblonga]|uniref:c-type cytochrome n=1 Tax=Moraxella oblonga TaxID=200413 RepID=UPI000A013F6D|nr:c-type cytochrome [Moraxella oblonga]
MKNPSKTLSLLLASAVFLTACGGDKPADTPKTEPKAQTTQTQPEAETPKADEVKADEPKAQDTTSEPKADNADTASTDKETTQAPKTDEPTKTETKTEVKALSLEEGKARYEKTCKVCHDQGLLDAPKISDKANWAKRLEKGVDTLHAHSAKGFGKMPAQATGDVSEAEVYAAVDYIISQVK